MTTAKDNCRIIVEVLAEQGVGMVVCSPGSRNTPLLLAVDACEKMRKHVVIDERSAAFMALGIAQATHQPVMLVCTSGTALLNYAPAVAEAYYQGLPLIVVSADRPMHIIDQDDSQTLRQREAIDNFVKKSYDVPDFDSDNVKMARYANRIANDAVITALMPRRGPVHINVQIDDPLNLTKPHDSHSERIINYRLADDILPKHEVQEMAASVAGKRILVIAGFMLPDARLTKAVTALKSMGNIYVMLETISNIHLTGRHWTVDTLLSDLTADERAAMRPGLVITLGGALVSRHLKEYLRGCGAEHWAIGHSHTTVDCFNSLAMRVEADPARFLSMFGKFLLRAQKSLNVPCYSREWSTLIERSLASHSRYIAVSPWSDLKAFDIMFQLLDRDINLQLSNGTAIRYAQLCMYRMPRTCHCNRGVSGIDGCLSTAIGYSLASTNPTLLITGDMSMSYDIGALANAASANNFKIVVVNNRGGGIFRFIGSTRELPQREEYFCAAPHLPLRALAEAYGIGYLRADDETSLRHEFAKLMKDNDGCALLEVCVDPEEGAKVLRNYFTRNQK